MSDTEQSTSKRAHEHDEDKESDNESDGWIGPLPTDAVPAKKQKSTIKSHTKCIQLIQSIYPSIFNVRVHFICL